MVKTVENTAIAEALMAAVAKMGNGKVAGKGREKPTPEVTAARKAANDAECIKVFEAAGYTDVQPRKNVLTYGKPAKDGKPATGWIAKGRRVMKGQTGHQVGPFNLFHEKQTEVIVEGAVH